MSVFDVRADGTDGVRPVNQCACPRCDRESVVDGYCFECAVAACSSVGGADPEVHS